MIFVQIGLLTVPFLENSNKFQNPFRRPVAMLISKVEGAHKRKYNINISLLESVYMFPKLTSSHNNDLIRYNNIMFVSLKRYA
jgi:hypothetical protein